MTVPAVTRLADADRARLSRRAQEVPTAVREAVAAIWQDVATRGDAALQEHTLRLDGVDLADPFLSEDEWERLESKVPADLAHAMGANMARIEAFHARQAAVPDEVETAPGVRVGRFPVPLDRVACYVPGGRASYPSTVLMTVVPARLAGVPDITVVTPPRDDGSVDPAVAYAARAAGASRILRAGGAQAVAALALGTASINAVDAIVGPGNAYVTEAKRLAAQRVRTDAPAGPSELLVLADASAPPGPIAWDLLAQAEHDPDSQVLLVTDDAALAEAVRTELEVRLPHEPRAAIIQESLAAHGALLVADAWDEAIAFANDYAPEHLAIVSKDPRADLARIRHAGSVFLGPQAPVSLGDYGSGTNHVLPTMGHARLRGGLALEDFRKWVTWQEVTPEGLVAVADDAVRVATAEGLHAHAAAVTRRLAQQAEQGDAGDGSVGRARGGAGRVRDEAGPVGAATGQGGGATGRDRDGAAPVRAGGPGRRAATDDGSGRRAAMDDGSGRRAAMDDGSGRRAAMDDAGGRRGS